mgnify:CR=1 FL=1
MTDTMWGVLALVGLGIVVIGNVLRARRTDNMGCLGHLFIQAQEMTMLERILNRGGIALFFAGVILSIAQ